MRVTRALTNTTDKLVALYKYCHESVLMREETGVPGEDPRSQVEGLKLSIHTTFVVEVGGVIDDHYACLTPQEYITGDFPDGQLRPTGLNFGEQGGTGVSLWCKPHFALVQAVKR